MSKAVASAAQAVIALIVLIAILDLRGHVVRAIRQTEPVEILMQQQMTVTLRKTVGDTEIEFPCTMEHGETMQEFGARCALEFSQFCEGFE